MRRLAVILLSAISLAGAARADMVKDYAAWKKLAPAERAVYAGAFMDGHLVGDGSREHAAYFTGVTACFAKTGITPAKLAEIITASYEKTATDRALPPAVIILRSVMRGTCLPFINAERKKYKLAPLTKSDG